MIIVNEPAIASAAIKTVQKLWGMEYWMVNSHLYCLKFLKVIPGYRCSIHAHATKEETFLGLSGTLRLMVHRRDCGIAAEHAIHPGQSYTIRPEIFHSFRACNVTWVMEVSTHHDDRDVIRLEESRLLKEGE